jgi:hypothetical protein
MGQKNPQTRILIEIYWKDPEPFIDSHHGGDTASVSRDFLASVEFYIIIEISEKDVKWIFLADFLRESIFRILPC